MDRSLIIGTRKSSSPLSRDQLPSARVHTFLLAVVLVLLKRGNYFSMLQDAMSDHTFQYTDNASYIQRKTQFELMPERNTDIVF